MKWVNDHICKVIRVCLIVCMMGMFVVTAVSVFYRYVLHNSIVWSEQLCRFLFVWMIMLGTPVLYRAKLATAFDLIVTALPRVLQEVVAVLVDCLVGLFGGYYAYAAYLYIAAAGARTFQGLGIPSGVIYVSQMFCGVILILFVAESLANRVRFIFTREEVN